MLTISDIEDAQKRIRPYLHPTLLEPAPDLGEHIFLKLENTNLTHSFKLRGALNAVLSLDADAKQRGLVAASSGNHAQGMAYAAHIAGARAQIYMPTHTPQRKVNGVRRYGAEAVLFSEHYDDAEAEAYRVAERDNLTFVSAYSDPRVIAGAGTIGLEIVEQLPDVSRVIVCVSGGGLISGIALAIKSRLPHVQVIGVNALSAPAMYNLFYGTNHPQVWDTLAEALSGDIEETSITKAMAKKYVDDIVLVTEDQIADAMRWMIDVQGWMVEGGGAVGVASLLGGVIAHDGQKTAVVVSGGNVDGDNLRQVLGSSSYEI